METRIMVDFNISRSNRYRFFWIIFIVSITKGKWDIHYISSPGHFFKLLPSFNKKLFCVKLCLTIIYLNLKSKCVPFILLKILRNTIGVVIVLTQWTKLPARRNILIFLQNCFTYFLSELRNELTIFFYWSSNQRKKWSQNCSMRLAHRFSLFDKTFRKRCM